MSTRQGGKREVPRDHGSRDQWCLSGGPGAACSELQES